MNRELTFQCATCGKGFFDALVKPERCIQCGGKRIIEIISVSNRKALAVYAEDDDEE